MKVFAYGFLLTLCLITILALTADDPAKRNPYNLDIIGTKLQYDSLVQADSNQQLVELNTIIPDLVLDLRYATEHNFTERILYAQARAFSRLPVARALHAVQKELSKQGLGLKIYDAYRPYSVTLHLYETYPDSTYVASPRRGSIHNRGCAVDISLVYLQTGEELAMPTPFDDFSEKAWPYYKDLPDSIIANRSTLQKAMLAHGFEVYPSEWWHFNYKDRQSFGLMDLSFEELTADQK